jgi:hypothetical protein
MRQRRRIFRTLFTALGALAAGGCLRSPGPPLHHEIFRAVHRTACVAPPQVAIEREKMTGTEVQIKESLAIEETLYKHISGALASKGYRVLDTLSQQHLTQRQELQDAVSDLQKKHDDILPLLYRDRSGAASGRFSLGSETAIVGEAAGADLIAFVRLRGLSLSGGKKALYFLLWFDSYMSSSHVGLFVTLVNAHDGTVLANLFSHALGNVLEDTESRLAALVERAFWTLPASGGRAVDPSSDP